MSALFILGSINSVSALEVEGFLTTNCEKRTGVIVHVSDADVNYISLEGHLESLPRNEIQSLYVFNVIENPIQTFHLREAELARLKAIYLDDSKEPSTLAFPVRFIDDLVLFFSLEGKSHVYTYADIHKLRPAPQSAMGTIHPKAYRLAKFEFTDQSMICGVPAGGEVTGVKPSRVLSDKISVSEFLNSFQQGYRSLEGFEERTYLYARPFLFDRSTRLGLIFQGTRSEPGLNLPLYFQWSSGEPYRFQSYSQVGLKNQEFTPNTEPVFVLRSDVKSHAFHGTFIGNVAGLSAGTAMFTSQDYMAPKGNLTVQPSFNYLAMMGGDYGPFSLSVGFFYPVYGIKVRDEYREVLGTSASYALRGMYTRNRVRMRVIGALTDYASSNPNKEDVVTRTGENGITGFPDSYTFHARFVRGGIDYQFSDRFKFGADAIWVNGNYKDKVGTLSDDIQFNKLTFQGYLTQSFGRYVSITAYANLVQNNYKSNFANVGYNNQEQETRFFGSFEFIF